MTRPLIRRKNFHNFHWTKKTSSRRGHEKLEEIRELYIMCFLWEEEENECVREELVVMCEEMLFMKKMCANKRTWKEIVCSK